MVPELPNETLSDIGQEIERIKTARNTIRSSFVDLGISESTDNFDDLADAAEGIVNRGAVDATVGEGQTYTVPAGYHNGLGIVRGTGGGGSYLLQAREATPSKVQQIITAESGYYGMSSVKVYPIPDNYVDKTGATGISATIDGLESTSVTIPEGYTLGGTVSLTDAIYDALAAL